MRDQENVAEATLVRADGVVRSAKSLGLKSFAELTTPSAALRRLRAFLLMPQPPLLFKEGNYNARFASYFSRIAASKYRAAMTVVEQIVQATEIGVRYDAYRRETLTLTWEERRQGHGRRHTDSGLEFAISLPGGTILKEGDCMILEPERTIVRVREAPEPVYIVRPKTPHDWAYYAYHVGNRHQQVMIGETDLVFLQNPAVRSLLEQLNVPFETGERPFTAALTNVGHGH